MTEAEALTLMKTECKVLEESLTDNELILFLNTNSKDDGAGGKIYNTNKAIYKALKSAITVLPKSFDRGGVKYTRESLSEIMNIWKVAARVGSADFPGVGVAVVIRDI